MMENLVVRDWMTPNPITITPDTTLEEAHALMDKHKIRHLPIIADDNLVSLISKRDLRRAELNIATNYWHRDMQELVARLKKVSAIMTYHPPTVEIGAPVSRAAQTMLDWNTTALPVIEKGRLVGIITESDIFRIVIEKKHDQTAA